MPCIRIYDEGQLAFECDDPATAVALRDLLAAKRADQCDTPVSARRRLEERALLNKQRESENGDSQKPSDLDFDRFWESLNAIGKKLMRSLAEQPEGLCTKDLARRMGVKPLGLGSLFQRDFPPGSVWQGVFVSRRKVLRDGHKTSLYRLSPEVLEKVRGKQ
jgi:hypothetical protein